MRVFAAVLARDLAVALRGGGAGVPLAFFLLVAAVLPFGIGADPATLARVSAGSVWIGALLACLLSLDRLFRADLEDGSLDILRTSPLPLEMTVLAKCLANWLTTGLPLALAVPAVGVLHGTPPAAWGGLALSLLVGTPSLTLLGSIGAALSAGLRASGLLIPVLVVPLSVPVLIFGAAAAGSGGPADAGLLYLGAIGLAALWIAPVASAMALRPGASG